MLLVILISCGRVGTPTPQDQKAIFNWNSVDLTFTQNNCLQITVVMIGAVENIQKFTLELEPLEEISSIGIDEEQQDYPNCPNCPFVPKEKVSIMPRHMLQSKTQNTTMYTFTHCPKRLASGYQWRFVISSILHHIPYIITPVTTTLKPL